MEESSSHMNNLEIIIPTYNRASHLERTLNALKSSPFTRITVLDNASTDNTPDIVLNSEGIKYIRNPENIGAELNYCKAVEISEGPYVWILGDDDIYCWEYGVKIDECVIEEILRNSLDLILPGVCFDNIEAFGLLSLRKDLLNNKHPLYYPLSFAPSLIFRRSLYKNHFLEEAKILATQGNLLPMIPFVDYLIQHNTLAWVSSTKTIDKGPRHGYSSMKALVDWILVSKSHNVLYESEMMEEMFGGFKWFKTILASLLTDKSSLKKEQFKKLCSLFPKARLFSPLIPLIPSNNLLSTYDGNR